MGCIVAIFVTAVLLQFLELTRVIHSSASSIHHSDFMAALLIVGAAGVLKRALKVTVSDSDM
jgi:hypothetical protein